MKCHFDVLNTQKFLVKYSLSPMIASYVFYRLAMSGFTNTVFSYILHNTFGTTHAHEYSVTLVIYFCTLIISFFDLVACAVLGAKI